jgi:hypothetical protein
MFFLKSRVHPNTDRTQLMPSTSLLQNRAHGLTLQPTRRVTDRYGICSRTIDRWLLKEELGFPKPILINRRRYWYEQDLIEWERTRSATAHLEGSAPKAMESLS